MPKVLVFKAPRRHVQKYFLAFFFSKIWPKKITSRDGCVLKDTFFKWLLWESRSSAIPTPTDNAVRAENITELILERAGSYHL